MVQVVSLGENPLELLLMSLMQLFIVSYYLLDGLVKMFSLLLILLHLSHKFLVEFLHIGKVDNLCL